MTQNHPSRSIRFRMVRIMIGALLLGMGFFPAVDAQVTNEAVVDLDETRQIIRGFGAANIMRWRPDMTPDEIDKAFGTDDGQIGLSILRLRIPPNANDFHYNLPTARAAHEYGVTLIASPWSPPAGMKTNNNLVGGELRENKYADFADYLQDFVDYMADNEAPVYAISIQNEPDITVSYESCDWSPSQMLKFIKENAGTITGTKVMAPESFQFRRQMSDPLLNDPEACENLDIVCGHIYGAGLARYPLAESKGKEIWMTEHLILETSWADNLSTGSDMNRCMLYGMSAYVWWYIVRFYGPIYDDGSDARTPAGAVQGEISKRGYVMSQFARFIRPGYYRIECTVSPQRNLILTAYKDTTSRNVAIVAVNTSSSAVNQTFTLRNGDAGYFTPYVTTETKDCEMGSSLAVTDGRFTATLEASSITTFVSDNVISGVRKTSAKPDHFKLLQNYPNPFNPVTIIGYSLPTNGPVSLKVYNASGCEMATLVDGIRQAGNHVVTFDGSHFPSGIYFYQLTTDHRKETRKLMLLK